MFDATEARFLDRLYATPDVVEQRDRTRTALAAGPGERLIDVGCGPGFLVCELAAVVGPSGHVTGVDTSAEMLTAARARAEGGRLATNTTFAEGDAVALPVDGQSMDAAAVTQVLEYVPAIEVALAELRRVLRPGGRVAILDTDWRSCVWHADDRERAERVLRAWEERFAHPHLPVHLPRLLTAAGFERPRAQVIPILNVALDPDTFSAGMLGTVAAWVSRRGGIEGEEAAAWRADVRAQDGRGTYFFSLCRYLFVSQIR